VFDVLSLARLPKSDLEASGLPSGFTDYADTSHVPDSYIAVISPGGAFWLGRNGDVRGGKPGNNIIGNDCI
jgi:hypothetical protein